MRASPSRSAPTGESGGFHIPRASAARRERQATAALAVAPAPSTTTELKLSTFVLTMFDSRTRLANDVADEIRKRYPNELINIPIQMGVVIFLFSYLGNYLDEKYGNVNESNTKIFTLLGVFLALYNVYRQVNQLSKEE